MTTQKKRYQSGHEIFKDYIPNYDEGFKLSESSAQAPRDDATELATTLLRKFESQLQARVVRHVR